MLIAIIMPVRTGLLANISFGANPLLVLVEVPWTGEQ